MNKLKSIAILIVCLFCVAILTSACGGGGKSDPPSYPFVPVPTPTPTPIPTPTPTPTVSPTPEPTPTPEKYALELSNTKFTLEVGATDNVTVTLNGEDVTDSVTYTVDEEAIATVEGGLITGVSAGVAIVKVHSDDALADETFVVNVTDPNLELSEETVSVAVGGEGTVKVSLKGEDVTGTVTYSVDDESIATVAGGTVTGVSAGSATVTVSLDGANSAVFTVEVISNPFAGAEVGDVVKMGNYFYTAEGEFQPIEWQVLDKKDNRLLVVSKYVLDGHHIDAYADGYSYSWADSDMCRWLNGYFYNTAFNNAEKSFIYSTLLEDVDSAGGTYNVFLLSGDWKGNGEINQYFTSDDERRCEVTPYASLKCHSWYGYAYYWLRTAYSSDIVLSVGNDGDIYDDYVYGTRPGVRPALWINL